MTNIMDEIIPYVIMEAHPDYNKPKVVHLCGSIKKKHLNAFLLKNLVEFVYDKINLQTLNEPRCIENYWLQFYDNSYMSNIPWSAIIFINGDWQYKFFNENELLNGLIKKRDELYISSSDSDDSNDTNNTSESIIIDPDKEDIGHLDELSEDSIDDELDEDELNDSLEYKL